MRAEPNGFRVHLLGRSDTLSLDLNNWLADSTHNLPESACTHKLPTQLNTWDPGARRKRGFRKAGTLEVRCVDAPQLDCDSCNP